MYIQSYKMAAATVVALLSGRMDRRTILVKASVATQM